MEYYLYLEYTEDGETKVIEKYFNKKHELLQFVVKFKEQRKEKK